MVKFVSLGNKFVENIRFDEIDRDNEDIIRLEYVTKYHVDLKSSQTSIARTYEDVNDMAVTLEIPKSDYKNKSFQKILEWSNLPVQDENYYRDLAINMIIAGNNEKTVLFSHGRITVDVKHNTKADYVTVEVFVKQKEDMFRGVVFGLELFETYREAREKIDNPVSLNVVVPVDVGESKSNAEVDEKDMLNSSKEYVANTTRVSLIDFLKSYGAYFSTDTTKTPYEFKATIDTIKNKQHIQLRIGKDNAFFLLENFSTRKIKNFFGTNFNPEFYFRADSPWKGKTGGFDYWINKEELKSLFSTYNVNMLKAWIPSEPLKFNGSSAASQFFSSYEKNFTQLHWNQNKINELWGVSNAIYNSYKIQIDPRFLLAIIIQEGTGSFNTSSTNRAADGQHGVEVDFAVDLMKANSLVFGKILGYIYYGASFRQAVSKNNNLSGINGSGNVFQYCNWSTPIIDIGNKSVWSGVYATHGLWGDNVKSIYNGLGGSANDYDAYLSNLGTNSVIQIAKDTGVKLILFSFVPKQDSQNSYGGLDGNWTINGEPVK